MISLDLLSYSKDDKVDILVTQYVNENLAIIIRVLLDYLNDDPYFGMDGFFPRDYLMREPIKCRNHVDELFELIKSPVRRDFLDPKYEYLLYAILQWWEESNEDEAEFIPVPVPDDLIEVIKNNPNYQPKNLYEYILEEIQNYQSYFYICFYDHDFLPSELSKFVSIYLRNDLFFNEMFCSVNLDNYVDLMPVDLREMYLKKRGDKNQQIDRFEIELQIVKEIHNILRNFQKRAVHFKKRSEPEISDDIRDAAEEPLRSKYNLNITRETPMGRAIKALGETDLYIYGNQQKQSDHNKDYAIIESKNVENFLDSFKQLLGYLNQYFHFGITISINRTRDYGSAWKKIRDDLHAFDDPDFPIASIEDTSIPYVAKSVHIIPEDKTRKMSIYHMIFNANDYERKRIAKDARPEPKSKTKGVM